MEEESENGTTTKLEFSEVLHLLTRKAVLGPGIPDKYLHPPWVLPSSQNNSQIVNSLLQYSMKIQSAHIPGSDEFQNFIISNSSLAVAGLLQFYLSKVNINSEVIFGILLWDEAARSGPEDYQGTPHIWLNVEGNPVDNTHVAFPPTADNLEYFFECKKMNSYLRENPLESKLKLFLGQQDEDEESVEVLRHNLRIMKTYSYSTHIKKYLAVSLRHCELNPGVKLYHIMMMDHLQRQIQGVASSCLEEELATECWACGKIWENSDGLKTCTSCKVAKYCDRNCQRNEWKVHKLLHQELDHTKKLLADNDAAAEEENAEGPQQPQD